MSIAFSATGKINAHGREYHRPLGPLVAENISDAREQIYAQLERAGIFSGVRTDREWSELPGSLFMEFPWGAIGVVELPATLEAGVAGIASIIGESSGL